MKSAVESGPSKKLTGKHKKESNGTIKNSHCIIMIQSTQLTNESILEYLGQGCLFCPSPGDRQD